MSYFLQYAGMSYDQHLDPTTQRGGRVLSLIDFMVIDGGSAFKDYVPGDVGQQITVVGGTFVRPAKGIITGVAGGMITSVTMTDGGLYYVYPAPFYNCTGGTGTYTRLALVYETMPGIFQKGLAGFPTSYNQFTMSMWVYSDCGSFGIKCLTPDYDGDPGGFGVSPGYIPSLTLQYDSPWFRINSYASIVSNSQVYNGSFIVPDYQGGPLTGPFFNILYSFDRASQKSQCYINDMVAPVQSSTWYAGTQISNTTNSIWGLAGIPRQAYETNSANFAAVWMRDIFIDLTVVANRRQFINADKTAVDPATLPSAPMNFYVAPGDQPSAIATNRGTGGPWQTIGTIGWSNSICAPMLVLAKSTYYTNGHYFYIDYETPKTGTLLGHSTNYPTGGVNTTTNVPDFTIRPGAYLVYTVVTPPAHGTLALSANGSFTYTPNSKFFGTDTFEYRATEHMDSPLQDIISDTATVKLYVRYPDASKWDFVAGAG